MYKLLDKFAFELLSFIKETGTGLAEIALTPYGQLRLRKRPLYYAAFNRLEKRDLVKKQAKGRTNVYFLTAKGKKLLARPTKKIKRKDGNSTIVIFDIPEIMRRQRTILRRYLQRSGYTLLQKSVLISPDQVNDELIELIRELKINTYVTILSARIERVM